MPKTQKAVSKKHVIMWLCNSKIVMHMVSSSYLVLTSCLHLESVKDWKKLLAL